MFAITNKKFDRCHHAQSEALEICVGIQDFSACDDAAVIQQHAGEQVRVLARTSIVTSITPRLGLLRLFGLSLFRASPPPSSVLLFLPLTFFIHAEFQ
jgi:hypothetical protein